MSSRPVIEARGLTKIYETGVVSELWRHILGRSDPPPRTGRPSLEDVTLDIVAGETVGILGANGAGKTTLLAILGGVLNATSDSIARHGSILPLLGVGTSFIADLSGRDNAELYLIMLGVPRAEARQRLPAIEAFADIGHHFDVPIWTYSSGMVARVAFAAALEVQAETYIIDETLSVGDAVFREKCEAAIMALQGRGRTFLLVTHSPPLLARMCTRGLVLDAGRLVFDGPPRDAMQAYGEIRAAADKRGGSARALGTSAPVSTASITKVKFTTESNGAFGKTGLLRFVFTPHNPVTRLAVGLTIKAATGIVLLRLPALPIDEKTPFLPGTSTAIVLSFEQRLLRGTYFAELTAVDDAGDASAPPTILCIQSFRLDVVETLEQAGFIDIELDITNTSDQQRRAPEH